MPFGAERIFIPRKRSSFQNVLRRSRAFWNAAMMVFFPTHSCTFQNVLERPPWWASLLGSMLARIGSHDFQFFLARSRTFPNARHDGHPRALVPCWLIFQFHISLPSSLLLLFNHFVHESKFSQPWSVFQAPASEVLLLQCRVSQKS